jgi:hypothetical protein
MKPVSALALLAAALVLGACDLRYALFGFPQPDIHAAALPLELAYREARGGLVILRARVNGTADVDFILDTGAPVTVLLEGRRTAALGLDTTAARPLGDPANPATPTGVIRPGFELAFEGLALSRLTAVVIPQHTLPCQERFDEIGFGGVIGADLFRRFVVEIDTRARRVRLHDPATWRPAEGASVVPIRFHDGHPFVPASVALPDGRIVEAEMNVDTGMNRALTLAAGSHPALAMPAGGKRRTSCYVNGVREEVEGTPVALLLGQARIEVAAPIHSEAPNAVDGRRTSTLGIGLFGGRRLFVDYPGRRLAVD